MAWFGQIVLFIMLGLLSFPSRLLEVAGEGLLVAVALICIARPVAATLSVVPFRFNVRELVFLSWGGLKGAVPITLATFPLMSGIEGGEYLFNVVFFVVLVSAITQGWSLPPVARKLGLASSADLEPPISIEINALRHVDAEIVRYVVTPSAGAAGQALRDLVLPDGVVMTLVVRGDDVIMPRGSTRLQPGDHVFITMRTELVPLVNRLFDPTAAASPLPEGLTLLFPKESTVGQLNQYFGIPGPAQSDETVGDLLEGDEDELPRLGPFLISPSHDPDLATLTYAPSNGVSVVDE
jgi:cell volume regulation protein A